MNESFPCIICGKTLLRVSDEYEGQPSEAVMCSSSGNYGSTVFDPMNGESLAFNICDSCLVKAGEQGRIMCSLNAMQVWMDGDMPSIVGWMRVDRPYIPWTNELPPAEEKIVMGVEEILDHFDDKKFSWNLTREGYEYYLEGGE